VIDHEAEDALAGMASLLGVKYTTARALAERAVDLVQRRLGRSGRSRTDSVPLAEARVLPGSLEQQTRHAVREEMALHLGDVVLRRIDLGTAGPPADSDLVAVARAMTAELGWSEARVRTERQDFLAGFPATRAATLS
jgi:glycerol-3-phosphate dehydrogenase